MILFKSYQLLNSYLASFLVQAISSYHPNTHLKQQCALSALCWWCLPQWLKSGTLNSWQKYDMNSVIEYTCGDAGPQCFCSCVDPPCFHCVNETVLNFLLSCIIQATVVVQCATDVGFLKAWPYEKLQNNARLYFCMKWQRNCLVPKYVAVHAHPFTVVPL